jgi:Transposase IS4
MSSKDPRFVVNALVHAKAMHVTSAIECHRRYGSEAKAKLVNGKVTAVETIAPANKKRSVTMITAIYSLGGRCMKVATLNSRSVKAGHVAAINNEGNEPGTGLVTGIRDTHHSTDVGGTAFEIDEILAEVDGSSSGEEQEKAEAGASSGEAPEVRESVVVVDEKIPATGQMTIASAHGINWVRASIDDPPLNGLVPIRMWSIHNSVGEVFTPGGCNMIVRDFSALDFFLLMFPPKQLSDMVCLTNVQLLKSSLKQTTASELLKFFGVIILTTKFEFTNRQSLWNTTAWSKYRPAPQFGLTGMSRHRFEELFAHTRWSNQPDERLDDCSSEEYRWMLVDDFVANFNEHRKHFFSPSELICVDESMSRWYGLGGHWINHGLPQYIAIDRKPENGCEIQNAACGVSGVMLRLKLVKGVNLPGVDEENFADNNDRSLLHGTQVLKHVVSPWFGSNRIVCADSYFASVGAAKELFRLGLRFIGVVKTATRGFPKTYLTGVELNNRGDFLALKASATADSPEYGAMVWMDRERRYFISTAGSFEAGTPYQRCRWRQVDQAANAAPEQVMFTIEQPKIAEIYYSTCGAIDRHNRLRQDDLRIEKKVETKDWSRRVNLTIFSMIVVDTWLEFNGLRNTQTLEMNQKEFYSVLSEELIDNSFGSRAFPRSSPNNPTFQDACRRTIESGGPRSGVLAHLTPVKRMKYSFGEQTTYRYQGRCKECQNKTTWQCSECEDNEKMTFLCSTKNGKRCFVEHLSRNHAQFNDFEL